MALDRHSVLDKVIAEERKHLVMLISIKASMRREKEM